MIRMYMLRGCLAALAFLFILSVTIIALLTPFFLRMNTAVTEPLILIPV
jgi:hypothetical protein